MDDQSFEWKILAKHLSDEHKYGVEDNYKEYEQINDYSGLSFQHC